MKRDKMMLESVNIGDLVLKNRFVVSALATCFCTDGYVNQRFVEYHRAKAKGGWGLIITENYAVVPTGRGLYVPSLWSDDFILGNVELVNAVHAEGSKIFAQLYHCGRQGMSEIAGRLEAPSAIPCPVMKTLPHAMTSEEIKALVGSFGDAAVRAKKAGFDGIELNLAHGYLLAEFLSAYSNKRHDEYGGSIDNRIRLPKEILSDIRDKCGADFPVICKISAEEFVPGGRTIEETIVIAGMLEKAGANAINVSAGVYQSGETIIPPMYIASGWLADYAEKVKIAVDIPVIVVGRINDPRIAENIVKSGQADLVAMGRAALADPALPKKYKEGHCEDIRKCLACQQGCIARLNQAQDIWCLANPTMGIEYQAVGRAIAKKTKVAVVGGGVAGMQAAITAAEEGHEVTLYEADDHLGGAFQLASVPNAKGTLATLVTWQKHRIEQLDISVKLNTNFTLDTFNETKPETVILCTGSKPLKPRSIPGIDLPNVVTATDVLAGKVQVGNRVVFAGGGLIGAETADELAFRGKDVSIIEMRPVIAPDEESSRRGFLMRALEDEGVKMYTNAKITEITDHSVLAECNGEIIEIPADNVVLSLGVIPYNPLENELEGKTRILKAGDAADGKNALNAVKQGYFAGIAVGR